MIALEHLGDGSPADRNFQRLVTLVLDTGGVTAGVRFGTDTVTFSGTAEETVTVTHGLGTTPLVAFTIPELATGERLFSAVRSSSSTDVVFQFSTDDLATTTLTRTIYWVVIG